MSIFFDGGGSFCVCVCSFFLLFVFFGGKGVSKFHYAVGCFPVSVFSVSGKADVAAAGAITMTCSTGRGKNICSDSFCINH